MRIVSLVPNATEILFALGAGDQVVGVSHECDYPAAARQLPQLTGSALAADLSAHEIDASVSGRLEGGTSLYTLDEETLAELEPDLIVTQSLCPVCAVSTDQVDRAVEPMAACPEVVSLDPRRLADLDSDIRRLGERLGLERRAAELLAELEERLDAVRTRVRDRERPRAVAIEWLEPPFVAGHWVPEMIAAAGGTDIMAAPGDASVRTDWARIHAADPDVLLIMPCGFDRDGAADQVAGISGDERWRLLRAVRAGRVHPLDANDYFSRPGPRLIDGVEILANLLHP